MEKVILTGDRPTGRLHLGHYVGSLRRRVELQNSGEFDKIFIFIADAQALTDNADNPEKVRQNVIEVALDYLSVGLDPEKCTLFVQTQVPELCELAFYYMNLVSVSRVQRNPTVKTEIQMRGFEKSLPMGFFSYPVSQAADITAFKATTVPDSAVCQRLPGTDGKAKMSKSLGNCIYLSDTPKEVKKKVNSMYTDPEHLTIDSPGHLEGNCPFIYLDAFASDEQVARFAPEFGTLQNLKECYCRGGVGDGTVKKLLINVLEEVLTPIRERRAYWEARIPEVYDILQKGSEKARATASATLDEVRAAMKINYFSDHKLIAEQARKYAAGKK